MSISSETAAPAPQDFTLQLSHLLSREAPVFPAEQQEAPTLADVVVDENTDLGKAIKVVLEYVGFEAIPTELPPKVPFGSWTASNYVGFLIGTMQHYPQIIAVVQELLIRLQE
ncbi:hypothetical protein HDU97_009394, partial [Phlyctochytrium planicorne]